MPRLSFEARLERSLALGQESAWHDARLDLADFAGQRVTARFTLAARGDEESVVALTEFIGPRQGAEEPEKSNLARPPWIVTASRISSGSFTTPSESTIATAS